MKRLGKTFVRNKDYGYRMSDPKIDFDLRGDPVQSNYVAIVKIKDCPKYERDGVTYYEPANTPSIPINHGGTYYGYGEWKKRKSSAGKWLRNEKDEMVLAYEYWQCTIYLVNDAMVYTNSLQRVEEPNK